MIACWLNQVQILAIIIATTLLRTAINNKKQEGHSLIGANKDIQKLIYFKMV